MNEYLLKIRGFVDLLALVGVNLSVKDHIDVIIDGLPSEYDTFFLTINSRTEDYLIEEIESLLLAQEARIEKHNKSLDSETAFVNITQGSGNFGRDNFSQGRGFTSNNQFSPNFGRSNFSPRERGGFQGRGHFNNGGRRSWNTWNNNATANAEKMVCQLCMKIGHFVDRCYYKYDPSFQGPRTLGFTPSFQRSPQTQVQGGNKPNMQVLMATLENICDTNWYPNSGASNHVTANANNLVEHTPYYGNEQVRGNDQVSKIVVMEGKLKDGMYAFDSSQIQLKKYALSQVSLSQSVTSHQSDPRANCQVFVHVSDLQSHNGSSTIGLWHDRLSHPSFKIVQTIMSLYKLSKFNKIPPDFVCKACYQEPLQLVYSDLWGPSPVQSSNGYKYYICFVDAFSKLFSPVSHGKSPLQLLFNHIPDYKALRIFGCTCNPNTRPYNNHKLAFRSVQCTFLESLSSQPQYYSISQPISFSQSPPILSSKQLVSSISTTSSPSPIALIPPINTTTHLENCQDSNAPIVSSFIPSTTENTHSMITRSKKGIFKPKVYSVTKEPQSADEALQNENWKIAMIDEYSVILRNNMWSLVDLPVGRKVIGCKWIFKVKENLDGYINKYKARLVAKEEVYMEQPKGFIEKSTSHLVCKLHKSLYGLHLSQTKYVHDLLCKAKMNNANGINTPMISGQQLTTSRSGIVKDVQLYRSVVGALQYVTITRP
ncbi:hypothetical protein AAG906_016440 [Vitis piasezkii]